MKTSRKHRRSGMTLVEVILAMAILGIVVVLMTPVMVSAINMIALSGSRHENAKNVAGVVENNLAGETVTASLESVSVALPGGITVDGQAYLLEEGDGLRNVDLYGYVIESMSMVDPTQTGGSSTTAVTTTTVPTTTDPSSSESSMPSTSATDAPIELRYVNVDVSAWRSDFWGINRVGVIQNTTTAMQYQVSLLADSSPLTGWITCGNGSTTIDLPSNLVGYMVVVRQTNNTANNKHLRIRPAPLVAFHKENAQFTSFYVYDTTTFSWRAAVAADTIELILTPGDTWNLVATGKKVKSLDTSYVYARLAASGSFNSGGTTIDDPASFPARITSFQ